MISSTLSYRGHLWDEGEAGIVALGDQQSNNVMAGHTNEILHSRKHPRFPKSLLRLEIGAAPKGSHAS